MHAIARLGFILIGVYISLDAIAGIARSFGYMAANETGFQPWLIGSTIAAALILGVLPGAYVALRAGHFADRLFEGSPWAHPPEASALVAAAAAVLGIFFIVRGASTVLATLAVLPIFGVSNTLLTLQTREGLAAFLQLLAGFLLFLKAHPIGHALSRAS